MIFLSSARSNVILAEVRDEIGQWAQDAGVDLWRFDDPRTPKEYWDKARICRLGGRMPPGGRLLNCDLYIAIFHGAYGGSRNAHAASVASTDLEIFEATSEGKKIRYFVIEPHEPEGELLALLTILKAIAPGDFGGSGSARRVLSLIKDTIAQHLGRRELRDSWRSRLSRRYHARLLNLRREELDSVYGLQVLPESPSEDSATHSPASFERALDALAEIEERSEVRTT